MSAVLDPPLRLIAFYSSWQAIYVIHSQICFFCVTNYALLYGIQKLMHTFTSILHMHFTQAYVYLFLSY